MGFIEAAYQKMFGKQEPKGDNLPHGTGIGPGGENICPTPGMRIRSQGMGRGLARGGGRGPIGRPIGRRY